MSSSAQEIYIGTIGEYEGFPAEIEIKRNPYILIRTDEGEFRLFLAVCPHAGGEVRPMNNGTLLCPLHLWRFDGKDGHCLSVQGESLDRYEVEVRGDQLYAKL